MTEAQWYAVMAGPTVTQMPDEEAINYLPTGQEFIAQHQLRMRGFRTFLPYIKIRRRYKMRGKEKQQVEWVRRAYYPGYLFAKIPDTRMYHVNECPGVADVVHQGVEPVAIPDEIIDPIRAQADMNGCMGQSDTTERPRFSPGQKVRFAEVSPFFRLVNAIVDVDNGKAVRVWIDQLFGDRRVVPVPFEHLAPVE